MELEWEELPERQAHVQRSCGQEGYVCFRKETREAGGQ